MKQKLVMGVIVGVFLLSRIFVLTHPPFHLGILNGKVDYVGYSDVQHDSERYANMWYYGLIPYRQHLFEYPPAAIPIMYIPLLVDKLHIGHYYLDYRVEIFLIECGLFLGIVMTIISLPIRGYHKGVALLFYIGAGMLAKDFWYDGLDLVFIGSLTLAYIWRWKHTDEHFGNRVVFWALFWLSVAVKLLTLPLGLPLLFLRRKEWQTELKACILGGIVVWGVPLALFRSSLSVFLFFHAVRPLKYEALGTYVIRVINNFTHTEAISNIPPHFPMVGPVSHIMETVTEITLPIAIMLMLGWSLMTLKKKLSGFSGDRLREYQLMLQVTLVYIFTLFLSSKIFSRPFHIWYVPLIAIYPFKKWWTQVIFILMALLMLTLDTTNYLAVDASQLIGPVHMDIFRDAFRFLPMVLLLVLSVRLPVAQKVRQNKVK